jgi:hypothetical protein
MATTPTDPAAGGPPPRELNDLAALKVLAHPRRGRIMRHLAAHGPATSAGLARALALNTGATSYHLRELARHGFVEEIDSPHGRERWWQAVRQDLRFPPRAAQSPEIRSAVDEMTRQAFAADLADFVRHQDATGADDPWADTPYSRGTIHVTTEELRAFFEEFIALVKRYKRPDGAAAPDVRTVQTRFLAFPSPASEALESPESPESPESLESPRSPATPEEA